MAHVRNVSLALISSLGLFLTVGCAAERHEEIPRSARLVADGQGKRDFIAPNDGMVYVYDRTAGNLIYSGRILEGERVEVEPMEDRITLNGRTVMDKQIRDNNEMRVFFRGEPRAVDVDTAGARSRTRAQQQPQQRQVDDANTTEIRVQPRQSNEAEIRVKPGADADSKIIVEPGDEGSKVTIEPK